MREVNKSLSLAESNSSKFASYRLGWQFAVAGELEQVENQLATNRASCWLKLRHCVELETEALEQSPPAEQ